MSTRRKNPSGAPLITPDEASIASNERQVPEHEDVTENKACFDHLQIRERSGSSGQPSPSPGPAASRCSASPCESGHTSVRGAQPPIVSNDSHASAVTAPDSPGNEFLPGSWIRAAVMQQLFTQSELDMSPQATVSTVVPANSVPHVQSVSFYPGDVYPPAAAEPSQFTTPNLPNKSGLSVAFGSVNSNDTDFGAPSESGRGRGRRHRESQSERDYHQRMQMQHKKTRMRHLTDPVDFDGVLRIIGGFGCWQIWVYFLISLQQIPHAMFNLAIIFMMVSPDHWCTNDTPNGKWSADTLKENSNWTYREIRNLTTPPKSKDKNKAMDNLSKCSRYDFDYSELVDLTFENAYEKSRRNKTLTTVTCSSKTNSNWSYDNQTMIRTIVTDWNLVCDMKLRRADAHLAYALGFLAGCIISGLSSDRFGRKPTVIGFGILSSLLGLILPYSSYFYVFLFVRFLSAVCNEAADLAAYVLCMEITGTRYRALVGSLLQLPWALGFLCLSGVAYLVRDWWAIQLITAALHSVSILLICVLPESPRWLIVNNRAREAETIIRRACRVNKQTLPPDLELIKHAERRQWIKRNERPGLLHLIKSRELVVRTAIICCIWAVVALLYYGMTLALSAQTDTTFGGTIFSNNALAAATEIPTLAVCVCLLSAGRKKSQMASLIVAGIMMLGVVLSFDKGPQKLSLVFMLCGKAGAHAAFVILYIFTSEMYPTVIRNTLIGFASMVARIGSGVAGYVAILSDVTFPEAPMIIFGVFAFVAATLVIFLPETMDQPLPDTFKDAVEFLKHDNRYGPCGRNEGFTSLNEDQEVMEFASQAVPPANERMPEPFADSQGTLPDDPKHVTQPTAVRT